MCGRLCRMSIMLCVFMQTTAYEMCIIDWSSDVCSSDLASASAAVGAAVWSLCTAASSCAWAAAGPARASDTASDSVEIMTFIGCYPLDDGCARKARWHQLDARARQGQPTPAGRAEGRAPPAPDRNRDV